MAVHTSRRLPGFRFEVQSPQLSEVLPRMDVAVFVGFAASGPLHTPVAIEDIGQFAVIFGQDAPLVWDQTRGEQVYAHLAPAVRAFFRNGGRRCWIVRLAGDGARSNYFPIPGLALAAFDEKGTLQRITPAFARARSEGSWSDSLRISAALLTQPVAVTRLLSRGLAADLALNSPRDIAKGDLLRVTFRDEGYVLMLAVESVEPMASSPPDSSTVHVTGNRALWFTTHLLTSPSSGATEVAVRVFTHGFAQPSSPLHPQPTSRRDQNARPHFEFGPIAALIRWPVGLDQPLTLDLHLSLADAPAPGSLVRVDVGQEQFWFLVQDVSVSAEAGLQPRDVVRVIGQALWLLKDAPQPLPTAIRTGEILTFELWVRQDNDDAIRLSGLGFEANHNRFWDALPTDKELYQDAGTPFEEGRAELAFEKERRELWRSRAGTRFPLAGIGAADALYFPIYMPLIPDSYLGPVELPGTQLERDGLSQFNAGLFLDPDLVEVGTTSFMAQADFLRYLSPAPRPLRGIHAALGFGGAAIIDEATIIAVPDAVHRGWCPSEEAPLPPAEVSSPLPRPEWWHFLDCDPPPEIPLARKPQRGYFLNCDIRVIPAPTLRVEDEPDRARTYTLAWSSDFPGAQYVLEESTRPNFSGAVGIYMGTQTRLRIYGRGQGVYYYRVHAEVDGVVSDWSTGVGVLVSAAQRWQQKAVEQYSSDTLLVVHRALLRMCAARGDLFAILALPEHYRHNEAIEHVATLTSRPESVHGTAGVAPLSAGEVTAFSYAAIYHPWLVGREERQPNTFSRTPPDGAVCGILAQRALTRGAWIAPANERLSGVVALTPPISRDHHLGLQEAQINLVRQEPRGFIVLSADTLSDNVDMRPINVRRLLILLRRLALRLGATYVFEPNDDSFRRLVQRGFEAMLDEMFVRGAFAGATPATSFQVVTSNALNTPQSVDQGRFIVEIRVAPSLPMTFLTIRLVQTGDHAFVTEGR